MADRHSVASGEEENQPYENRMKDIHIGKSGSETANEEQLDKSRKTVRFEKEAPNFSSSSIMHVSHESPANCEKRDRLELVFLL